MRSDRGFAFERESKIPSVIQGQSQTEIGDILNIGSLYLIQLYFKITKETLY
jgi:hypothetical protein